MKTLKTAVAAAAAAFLSILAGCSGQRDDSQVHPDWAYNSVVYEMNVRQYTPEGIPAGLCKAKRVIDHRNLRD